MRIHKKADTKHTLLSVPLAARGKSRLDFPETAFTTPPEGAKMAESDFYHGLLGHDTA